MMMSWLAEHEGAVGGERELRAAGGAGSGSAPSACSHRPVERFGIRGTIPLSRDASL